MQNPRESLYIHLKHANFILNFPQNPNFLRKYFTQTYFGYFISSLQSAIITQVCIE